MWSRPSDHRLQRGNVENVQYKYKDIEFNMLDVGGQDKTHVLPN